MNRRQLIKAGFLAVLASVLAPVAKLFPQRWANRWPLDWVWCPYVPLMVTKVDINLIGCYTPIVLRSDGEKWEPIGNILRSDGEGHTPNLVANQQEEMP